MRELYQVAGISDDSLAHARAAMGRQMRSEGEDFIDEATRRTMALPGYRHLDIEAVRPNTRRSFLAILATLDGGDMRLFGELLYEIAYARAKQGLPPRSLYEIANVTEELLAELGARCLVDTRGLLSAAILAREIADGARAVIIDAFQKAHFETRTEVDRLVSQFSAPILPALPGVLVLPIVGAVTASRADQIVEALLDGVVRYAAHIAILDITGITDVDASLSAHLRRATSATQLIGARVVLVGVNPAVARTLVAGDVDLAGVSIHPTLAAALLAAGR